MALEMIKQALPFAARNYAILLDDFNKEYERLIADDKDRRWALIWSRAFSTAGKFALQAASVAEGLKNIIEVASKYNNHNFAELTSVDKILDTIRLVDQYVD